MTARVVLTAVDFIEIFFYLLKARLMAVSHLWSLLRFMTARVVLMAVDFSEIFFYLLKARLRAVSHLWPVRRFMTARVLLMAVDFIEIFFYLLKARLRAVSHLWPVRRFVTARVTKTAVSIRETTFYLLLVKITHEDILPSPIIKNSMSDCLQAIYFSNVGSSFSQEWVNMTASGIWFESHMALRMCIIWQYRLLIRSFGSRTQTSLKKWLPPRRKITEHITPHDIIFANQKGLSTTWQPRQKSYFFIINAN